MPLERLLEAIERSTREEIEDIQRRTSERAQEIRSTAEEEAARAREKRVSEARRRLERERVGIMQQARFEAGKIVGRAQEELADEVVSRVGDRLRAARDRPDYERILRRLLAEALGEFREGPAEVHGDPRDGELLERLLDDLNADVSMTLELETWGGVIVRGGEARAISVDNTLETRLALASDEVRERALTRLAEHTGASFGTTDGRPNTMDAETASGEGVSSSEP